MGCVVTDSPFWPRKSVCPYGEMCRNMKGQVNYSLRRRHFALNRRPVVWIIISNVHQYRWLCASPWKWLEEMSTGSLARQRPLSVPPESTHRKASIIIILCLFDSARCSFCISVVKHLDASFNVSKPLRQLQNRQVSLLRVILFFQSFCKALWFRISIRWSNETSWSWDVRNSKTPSPSFAWICALLNAV